MVRGIDAANGTVPVPHGFVDPPGGFGCTRSHARVLEDALMDEVGSVLVLEDDAVFDPGFGEKAKAFLAAVPGDWEGLYFGGQHVRKPLAVGDGVVKCMMTYRTHAYAARGAYLCGLSHVWGNCPITLDHCQAEIVAAFNVYAPERFIAGQGGGKSEITGLTTTAEYWNEDWSGPRTFIHGQDIGDVIFGLPAMRDSGGGKLVLFHDERMPCSHILTAERFRLIQPLLALQGYVEGVEYKNAWQVIPEGFNNFRHHVGNGVNLAAAHYRAMGLPVPAKIAPWLVVDRVEHEADVVFSRSPRWTNPHRAAIWRKLYRAYGQRAVFVGLPEEWQEFEATVGKVRYVPTADLLEAARVIAGAKLFCGNQSCPLAIAIGLGQRCVVETCVAADNCRFPGPVYAIDGDFEPPTV